MTLTWTKRILRSRPKRIRLIRGRDKSQRPAWYYVLIKTSEILFERAMLSGTLNLTDYAEILRSGFGENPPAEVVKQMKEEYGFSE